MSVAYNTVCILYLSTCLCIQMCVCLCARVCFIHMYAHMVPHKLSLSLSLIYLFNSWTKVKGIGLFETCSIAPERKEWQNHNHMMSLKAFIS